MSKLKSAPYGTRNVEGGGTRTKLRLGLQLSDHVGLEVATSSDSFPPSQFSSVDQTSMLHL